MWNFLGFLPIKFKVVVLRVVSPYADNCSTWNCVYLKCYVGNWFHRMKQNLQLTITPWNRFLFEELTFTQLVKIFPAFYGTGRLIIVQVEIFWIVMPCNIVVGYQCFRDQSCLPSLGWSEMKWSEDGGSMDLWSVGILPQHYTASQLRRPRFESSLPWKPQIFFIIVFTRTATVPYLQPDYSSPHPHILIFWDPS
jgi:hypothetical protein